jgi:hypothetical protein
LCAGIGAHAVCADGVRTDDGEWHHIALSYQAETFEATLYIDGRPAKLKSSPWDQDDQLIDATVSLGAMFNGGAGKWEEQWDGSLSRVAIYDGVLTPEQIDAHYVAVGRQP